MLACIQTSVFQKSIGAFGGRTTSDIPGWHIFSHPFSKGYSDLFRIAPSMLFKIFQKLAAHNSAH